MTDPENEDFAATELDREMFSFEPRDDAFGRGSPKPDSGFPHQS